MKFKITITKEVIDKSLMCGVENSAFPPSYSCAFSVAYSELVPVVCQLDQIFFVKDKSEVSFDLGSISICTGNYTREQKFFISTFDELYVKPMYRYSLVGQTFDVEIPDEVIEYWYGDASKAAQKIIDNPIMQVVC